MSRLLGSLIGRAAPARRRAPFFPTCITNLPSIVYFRIWESPPPPPPSHTLFLWSMWMPCSWSIHGSFGPGPQCRSRLPFWSNSRTSGAVAQHISLKGGFISRPLRVFGLSPAMNHPDVVLCVDPDAHRGAEDPMIR